ncbi:MAG: TIGR04290 family methyltransferase [Phycisphaeraceae bacterium]
MTRSVSETGPGQNIQSEIESLGPWFHNIHLPGGQQTAPDHSLGDFPRFKWEEIAGHLPEDLSGWDILDIGCNAGYYSIELARRGGRVLGIDHDPRYLRQAGWAVKQFGLEDDIEFEQMQVYDLARLDRAFDLVLFMGVFYHLRYPLLALDLVAEKVRRQMVFQTLTMPGEGAPPAAQDREINDRDAMLEPGWPKMAFIEHRLSHDPTNWWAANSAGVEAMLRSTGMRVTERPGHEIWLCEPDPEWPPSRRWWETDQLDAATGRAR